jgi:hypothetical protein
MSHLSSENLLREENSRPRLLFRRSTWLGVSRRFGLTPSIAVVAFLSRHWQSFVLLVSNKFLFFFIAEIVTRIVGRTCSPRLAGPPRRPGSPSEES